MDIQSVSFTARVGKDYKHFAREVKTNRNWKAMEKQIASNKAKINSIVAKLQDPSIPNIEKKSLLAKVNRLIDENDRMSEIIDNRY